MDEQKFTKVSFNIEYIIPADREDMLDLATECVIEDVYNAVKYDEVFDCIEVESAPDATEEDVPDFLKEILDEEKQNA